MQSKKLSALQSEALQILKARHDAGSRAFHCLNYPRPTMKALVKRGLITEEALNSGSLFNAVAGYQYRFNSD